MCVCVCVCVFLKRIPGILHTIVNINAVAVAVAVANTPTVVVSRWQQGSRVADRPQHGVGDVVEAKQSMEYKQVLLPDSFAMNCRSLYSYHSYLLGIFCTTFAQSRIDDENYSLLFVAAVIVVFTVTVTSKRLSRNAFISVSFVWSKTS